MSRNGSGTYSLPVNSWNPATNGVSATPADWQSLIDDVEAALTQSVSKDGQTTMTGNLPMGGFKLTGLAAGAATGQSLRWEQLFAQGTEADIASATTTTLGTQNSNFLRVTGTTTITSFGTTYNGPRFLRFEGALTLTHSSTLILPTGANITTAAGDLAIAIPKATLGTPDGWYVFYQRADGTSLLGVTPAQIQAQTYTAFTTAGTATAYTLTPTPALSALTAGQRFRVKMDQANSGTTPTLAVSGLAATAIKMYVTDGTKRDPVAGELAAGLLVDMEYDGTNWVCRTIPAQLATATPAVGTAAGTVGTGLDAARGDHAHPPMSGSVIQESYVNTATGQTAYTNVIPEDGTIPQNTEGDQIASLAFTPKLASSTLKVEFTASAITGGSYRVVGALFVDSTANAIDTHVATNAPVVIRYYVAAGSTSARTYKVRFGPAAAGTAYLNGNFGTAAFGTLSVTEYAA